MDTEADTDTERVDTERVDTDTVAMEDMEDMEDTLPMRLKPEGIREIKF